MRSRRTTTTGLDSRRVTSGHRRWWKTTLLAFALVAALLCGLAVLPGGAWAAGWTSRTSGTTSALRGVAFANASDGWAVGAAGTIVATTNGGTTWTAQTSNTDNTLYGVACANASDAWAVGDDGSGNSFILATTNGGTTWTVQTSNTDDTLNGVAFANANDGWAVGDGGTVLATSNGGTTWTVQTSNTANDLYGVTFVSASDGWAVGNAGTVLATSNGGTTWTAQTSGTTSQLRGVTFAGASDGWAVGYTGGNSVATILATTDGGVTWSTPASGAAGELWSIAASDASHVWTVGAVGTAVAGPRASSAKLGVPLLSLGCILASNDGGLTWGAQASYSTILYGVAFSDGAHGWAVGAGGTIMAYTCVAPVVTVNGADASWHTATVDLAVNATVDPSLSLAKLQYSLDGGSTWRNVPGSGSARTLPIATAGKKDTVTVRATDSGGQTGSAAVTVKVDRTVPTISVSGKVHGWQRRPVTLTFNPKVGPSGVAKVQYKIGSGDWKQVGRSGGVYRVTIKRQGSHKVSYRVTTKAGVRSKAGGCTVRIDTRAPRLTLASSSFDVTAATGATLPVVLKWTDDYSSTCSLRVLVTQHGKQKATQKLTVGHGGSWQTIAVPWGTLVGHYTLTFKLYDAAGNVRVVKAGVVASI